MKTPQQRREEPAKKTGKIALKIIASLEIRFSRERLEIIELAMRSYADERCKPLVEALETISNGECFCVDCGDTPVQCNSCRASVALDNYKSDGWAGEGDGQ